MKVFVDNHELLQDDEMVINALSPDAHMQVVFVEPSVKCSGSSSAECSLRSADSLYAVQVPEDVSLICSHKFHQCTVARLWIPDSVISIGESGFKGCNSMTSLMIPDSVTYIGVSAFQGCSSLTNLTIPSSVTEILEFAFDGCSLLTSRKIPVSLRLEMVPGRSSMVSLGTPESLPPRDVVR